MCIKSPLWVLPFIDICVQRPMKASFPHIELHYESTLAVTQLSCDKKLCVKQKAYSFLIDIGFWKEWKEYIPDSSWDSSCSSLTKSWTNHLTAISLNFQICKMRRWKRWYLRFLPVLSSYESFAQWLILPPFYKVTVSLLCVKRKRVLERNGYVNNVTILQERKYDCYIFLKRLKIIFILSKEFHRRHKLWKGSHFQFYLEAFQEC